MDTAVDLRTVRPDSETQTSGVVDDRETTGVVDDQAISLVPLDSASTLPQLYGYCRDACGNLSYIRVVAASAIVAGILFSTAPTALAPVGLLFATAPVARAEDDRTPDDQDYPLDDPIPDAVDLAGDTTVQPQSSYRSVAALITWDGTSEALQCSYGLLVKGDTASCKHTRVSALE